MQYCKLVPKRPVEGAKYKWEQFFFGGGGVSRQWGQMTVAIPTQHIYPGQLHVTLRSVFYFCLTVKRSTLTLNWADCTITIAGMF